MDNVPVHVNSPARAGRPAEGPVKRHEKNKLKFAGIVGGIIVLLIILLSGWLIYRSSVGAQVESNKYQAVFFTNGQVYFGNLQKLSGGYFKLTDIFYLQAKSANDSKNPQETSDQQASDVQLIKLGSEVHGPEDSMIINKDQVLFFENLKKDGKVSQSIDKYNTDNKK